MKYLGLAQSKNYLFHTQIVDWVVLKHFFNKFLCYRKMRIQTSSSENKWKGKNIKKIIIHLFEGTFKNLQGSSLSKASENVTIISEACGKNNIWFSCHSQSFFFRLGGMCLIWPSFWVTHTYLGSRRGGVLICSRSNLTFFHLPF